MKARLYMLCTVLTLLSCGRGVEPGRVVTNPIDLD